MRGGPPVARIEGGDRIEFFGWRATTYWDESAHVARLERLLDLFLEQGGENLSTDPPKRVLLQHDLRKVETCTVQLTISKVVETVTLSMSIDTGTGFQPGARRRTMTPAEPERDVAGAERR